MRACDLLPVGDGLSCPSDTPSVARLMGEYNTNLKINIYSGCVCYLLTGEPLQVSVSQHQCHYILRPPHTGRTTFRPYPLWLAVRTSYSASSADLRVSFACWTMRKGRLVFSDD
jgi:hypothetical protein